jgi:hypothetical protein
MLQEDNDSRKQRIWELVAEEFVPGVTMGFLEWFRAVRIEVRTRFVLEGKTNLSPSEMRLDVAENIFLRGIAEYPQSGYLQLQYILFLTAYRQNFAQAKLKLDELERSMNTNLGMRFSIHRKRKDLDRLRQEHESGISDDNGMGNLGFDEVQRMEALATEQHDKCINHMVYVWRKIRHMYTWDDDSNETEEGRKREQSKRVEALCNAVEKLALVETKAEEAYVYVLTRCKAAVQVYRSYAKFVLDVKCNLRLSREVLARADDLDRTNQASESKSQGSSSRMSTTIDAELVSLRAIKLASVSRT